MGINGQSIRNGDDLVAVLPICPWIDGDPERGSRRQEDGVSS